MIYNKSLCTGCFPKTWKEARVVPIFKSGDKSAANNYRPVSILSIFGKVFEALVYPILSWHVKQSLMPEQHGFMKGRSTATNLACFISDLVDAVDRGSPVDVIYTDFSKAFDKVDHKLLVKKLHTIGIAGNLLQWCESYLVKRTSKVVVNGYSSKLFLTRSGVPQGSHLGPLFFNIFINDVTSCFVHSKIYVHADDLKIIKRIECNEDTYKLQEDLDRFSQWCSDNNMLLNADKCNHVHFSRRKGPYFRNYKINDQVIYEKEVIRDLGVYIDNKLRFNIHVDKIATKGFKMLGFILRNCKDFKRASTKIAIFNSIVRSGLEYCSVVWTPFYEVHKRRLESVQKRFLWHLSYHCNMARILTSYSSRLKHFKLMSLENRRVILDHLFLYKIINTHIDCPRLLSQVNLNVPYKLARKSKYRLLRAKGFKTNLGHFSTINRMQVQFGRLSCSPSVDIDMSCSLHTIKSVLRRVLSQSE